MRNHSSILIRRPMGVLTGAFITTSLAILFFGGSSYFSNLEIQGTIERGVRLEELRGIILHLDEVLTMSARMGAVTGDGSWEERYLTFEPQLDRALQEAMTLNPLASSSLKAAKTNAANIKLVEMEKGAFDLIRNARMEEAHALLFSDEYEKHKHTYADGMREFSVILSKITPLRLKESRQQTLWNFRALVFLIPLLAVSWMVMFRAMLRWDARLSKVNAHLTQQSEELQELNCSLDSRVSERRQELEFSRQALRESVAREKAILESAADAIITINEQGNVQSFNPAAVRLFGYATDEIIGHNVNKLMPSLYQEELEGSLARDFSTGVATLLGSTLELVAQHKSGRSIPMELSLTEFRLGEMPMFTGIVRDLTERKLAEEALRTVDMKLHQITDSVPGAVYRYQLNEDDTQRFLFFSRGVEDLFEVAARDAQEDFTRIWNLILDEDVEPLWDSIKTSAKMLTPWNHEFRIRTVSGKSKWIRGSSIPEPPKEDNSIVWNGLLLDITQSKQAAEELEVLSDRHQLILNSAGEGIYGLDLKGNTTFINPAGALMIGWSPEELIGQPQHAILHHTKPDGSPYPREECPIYAAFKDGAMHHVDTEVFWRKDGTNFPVEYTSRPIRGPEGGLVGAVVTFRDITQRRQSEEQVRHAEVQLRQSQKMNALGTLAGGIAHDFNNILAALMGYTELILNRVPYEETVARYLKEVLTAGSRAKELVQQILTFSRQTERQKKPLHLQQVIQEVLMLIRATLPSSISIQEELSVSSDLIHGDSTQIHQVLMNLCTNAEYAMRDQVGVLTLRLEMVEEVTADGLMHPSVLIPGPHLILTVKDTGNGMPPEVLDRIFDPFFTTKGPGEGTGMGLAVVHGIIAAHHGRITVTSTPGAGTTVSIVFPLLAATATDTSGTDAELPSAMSLRAGQGHVLLVDDEAPLVALGKELLEEFGYEVTTRTSSLEALEAFRAAPSRYDVVITDQTMPNLSGEALAREILQIRSDIPILLCTGFSHTMTEEKARELGIRKFLMKPLLRRDLVLALQEVLEEVGIRDKR